MLTPQDITEKGFVKAVFGGYDMEGVDNFLEAVSNDYNALYKENAILKGKLKVLVEKVEEYRSTEDAMRMALLTAQRMGEEITVEAKRTKEEMLLNTENEIKMKLSDTAERIVDEEKRLAVATKETAKFIELSQAILRKHAEFLDKLEAARRTVTPRVEAKQVAQDSGAQAAQAGQAVQAGQAGQAQPAQPVQSVQSVQPVQPVQSARSRSAKQTPPAKTAQPVNEALQPKAVPQPMPVPESAQQVAAQPISAKDMEIDDIASQIGSIVGQMTGNDPLPPVENISAPATAPKYAAPAVPAAPVTPIAPTPVSPITFDAPPSSLFEDEDGAVRLYTTDDELENTSPRPKFDFDDLKFGANFDSDD